MQRPSVRAAAITSLVLSALAYAGELRPVTDLAKKGAWRIAKSSQVKGTVASWAAKPPKTKPAPPAKGLEASVTFSGGKGVHAFLIEPAGPAAPISHKVLRVSVWVKGSGTGHGLAARFADAKGRSRQVEIGRLAEEAWKRHIVPVPSSWAQPLTLTALAIDDRGAPGPAKIAVRLARLEVEVDPRAGVGKPAKRPTGFERWEPSIRRFEEQDRKSPPPTGEIVFVGSSSIRGWNTKKYFPDLKTIQRGFGGSQVADSVHFAERIVLKYRPRIVVLYAGDNDIAAGKTPQRVLADFRAFVKKVHDALPRTRIVYVAIKPSIARWKLVEKMRAANRLIADYTKSDMRLRFVDIDTPMIGPDDRPRKELFVKDGLHLSHEGYVLWSRLVRKHLDAKSGT